MKSTPAIAISALLACLPGVEAQTPAGSILHVEFMNSTLYIRGYCGPADRGQNPNKLPPPTQTPFTTGLGVADIVSVNGEPVKGNALEIISGGFLSSTLTPGRAIGDFNSTPASTSWELMFLNLDGTQIGSVHIDGNGGTGTPPGAPSGVTSWIVTGGSGAFFGVRGYFAAPQDSVSAERQTTDCEDPAYRRINADAGGNKRHPILYLVPLEQPQIAVIAGAPAVYHSDLTPVTAAKPATAGEVLIAMATGFGPVRPGVDPGQPFPAYPANPLQVVNSPLGVTVNQQAANVINAFGWPGLIDMYRVDFRVPAGTTGRASIQLSSAWIAGPAVTIPVQ